MSGEESNCVLSVEWLGTVVKPAEYNILTNTGTCTVVKHVECNTLNNKGTWTVVNPAEYNIIK